MTTMTVSGSVSFRLAPISAPARVDGSMTTIRSQSIKGRSAAGCLFLQLRSVFATPPPNTVTLLSGMACLGRKPNIRM